MVAQITVPKSIKRALNYNEKKVQQGKAELLHAQNFLKLPQEMNFHDKLDRFERQMELNERAQTKVIHISLNFPPEEKEKMTKEFLITLADEYMERIGFGSQPYLVYQHHDSGHPHVHVVSTLIKDDGSRINTHHLGKDVSDPARKEMEVKYGLISSNKKEYELKQEKEISISPQRVQAGKSEVQRSITNVLDHVVEKYKYTSLNELNAVLKLYNVKADRGVEGGRIHEHKGLTYVVIDKDGKALTKPIKASVFHNKPTLDYIEGKFKDNELKRLPDKKHIKTAVEWAMQSEPRSLAELAILLKQERIDLVIRRNEQGRVFGMTYIDHEKRAVFNGSDLGKEYAAKRMLERLGMELQQQPEKELQKQQSVEHQKTDSREQHPDGKEKTVKREFERHKEATMKKEANPSTKPEQTRKEPDKTKSREQEPVLEESGKAASKIIEQVVDPYSENGDPVNTELLNQNKHKRKKGLGWEMDL